MKYSDLRAGMKVVHDLDCINGNVARVYENDEGFFISDGTHRHFLDGQIDFYDGETLVGINEYKET